MAKANTGRSRSKAVVTVVSLSLAVVLLNFTVMFTGGFDMDKYLANNSVSDFITANARYFQTGNGGFSEESRLTERELNEIKGQGGIKDGGRVYGQTGEIREWVSEDYFRQRTSQFNDPEYFEREIKTAEHDAEGKMADSVQLSGMEAYPLGKLTVWAGDLSKVKKPGSRYIAAVYSEDDYGKMVKDSHWAKLGDTVKLRYVRKSEYYNPDTGKVYKNREEIGEEPYRIRSVSYTDREYEVAALVSVPSALSYRYYGDDEFVLNDRTFIRDTGTANTMLYAFDTEKKENAAMEKFLMKYTDEINPNCSYESKATYQKEFERFRSMFVLLGGVLSFIVGLVGILNFFNAVLTGIVTRKREFAMLQSIGMTGKQLKKMLVYEGLIYALGSIVLALAVSLAAGPLVSKALSSMFWFFTYRPTVAPVLLTAPVFGLLGCAVPLAVYRAAAKQTIVERLRETEN